jgi:ABC-2 type transport system permease protein
MKDRKYLTVAKFEFLEMVKKPSFWLATLFLPVLIGVIGFISGYSSKEAMDKLENSDNQFNEIFIVDDADIVNSELLSAPFVLRDSLDDSKEDIKTKPKTALIYFSEDFLTDQTYDIYFKKTESILTGGTLQTIGNAFIKQQGYNQVENPTVLTLLSMNPSSNVISYDENNQVSESELEQYIMPVASLMLFFIAVFISSSFMLQSVSKEKENRMIETILAIVDKKSLIIGKMVGLTGIVLVQLLLWVGLGALSYYITTTQMDLQLPIDLTNIDLSTLPLNLFLILTGFLFFSAIMVGTGAIGTGAQDSKNLSSIFILLAIFPMYLMQIFIIDPSNSLAKILSYFPFTSYMVLLIRNSLGALSTTELIIGIVLSLVYVLIAIYIAIKMFELGCLMYNRRPTFKEMRSALKQK